MVQLYGRNGSFGSLAPSKRLPSGQSFSTVPVSGWGFSTGHSAYMTAVTGSGCVVIGTTPYTDNQLQPTASTMELGYLVPGTRRFNRVTVPSTLGKATLSAPGSRYGGGDIGDVLVVGSGARERVLFCSAAPYHGWNPRSEGLLPSFGALQPTSSGGVTLDAAMSRTANQMAAGTNTMRMPLMDVGGGQTIANSRGLNEMAQLPASGDIVITQYFGPSMQNQQGGILVMDSSGRVKASWQYPAATFRGWSIKCLVREVDTDPTGVIGDERFVIICDAFYPSEQPAPFPAQEFSYNARTGTIRPVSVPFQASGDGSRMETAKYGVDGSLFVARTKTDGLSAADVAVYRKGRLALVAPAGPNWATTAWSRVVAPDQFVSGTQGTGLVRSIALDPISGSILVTGLSGQLLASRGTAGRARVAASLDLGLNNLVDRYTRNVGVRKGAVDAARRALWLPVPQLSTASYPSASYPNLDQWLYRVDLHQFVGI